jgi:hypothetical protein
MRGNCSFLLILVELMTISFHNEYSIYELFQNLL